MLIFLQQEKLYDVNISTIRKRVELTTLSAKHNCSNINSRKTNIPAVHNTELQETTWKVGKNKIQ